VNSEGSVGGPMFQHIGGFFLNEPQGRRFASRGVEKLTTETRRMRRQKFNREAARKRRKLVGSLLRRFAPSRLISFLVPKLRAWERLWSGKLCFEAGAAHAYWTTIVEMELDGRPLVPAPSHRSGHEGHQGACPFLGVAEEH